MFTHAGEVYQSFAGTNLAVSGSKPQTQGDLGIAHNNSITNRDSYAPKRPKNVHLGFGKEYDLGFRVLGIWRVRVYSP